MGQFANPCPGDSLETKTKVTSPGPRGRAGWSGEVARVPSDCRHHEAGTLTPVAACSMHRVANGSQTRQPWFALVTVVSRDAGKGGEAASGLSSRWEVEEAAVRVCALTQRSPGERWSSGLDLE